MAVAIEVGPLGAFDALKIEPGRAAQVAGIGHQFFALQILRKKFFAEFNRGIGVGFVQAMCQPNMLGALNNKGRGLVVKLVDVRLKPAVLGLFKQKGERVVLAVGAKPYVAIGPRDNVGLKHLGHPTAHARVNAVTGNDQIGIRKVEV